MLWFTVSKRSERSRAELRPSLTSGYTITLRWSFAISLEIFLLYFSWFAFLVIVGVKPFLWIDSKKFLAAKPLHCKWFFSSSCYSHFLLILFSHFLGIWFFTLSFYQLLIWFKFTSFTQAYEPRWIFSLLYFPPILVWSLLQLIFSQEFWLLVH